MKGDDYPRRGGSGGRRRDLGGLKEGHNGFYRSYYYFCVNYDHIRPHYPLKDMNGLNFLQPLWSGRLLNG